MNSEQSQPDISIRENLERIRSGIAAAAKRAGRKAESVRLSLVTKKVDAASIRAAYDCGVRDFGENRVQEFLTKREELPSDIQWHFIGHLQRNKVKDVITHAALIHSLDRLELAEEIERQALTLKMGEVPCLVQINSSGEASKFGIAPDAAEAFIEGLPGKVLRLCGLMTIGPNTRDERVIRAAFRKTYQLFERIGRTKDSLSWNTLSMGMSGDYALAVEEGATLLRIGSAVFGPRPAG
jgi:PLP dependent protein